MRIYSSAAEMVKEVERDLFEMGTRVHPETMQDKQVKGDRGYETIELMAYGYTLSRVDLMDLELVVNERGNLDWARSEIVERLQERYLNPGDSWKRNAALWEPFLRDGQFSYTYNERFREQIPAIVRELQVRPNSRQVIMTMYDRHQDVHNWGGKDRIPCSLTYQFLRRDEALHLIYSMRSCDFVSHFIHDVYLSCRLLMHVASATGNKVGTFTHVMGSLHAYAKDLAGRGIF